MGINKNKYKYHYKCIGCNEDTYSNNYYPYGCICRKCRNKVKLKMIDFFIIIFFEII